MSEINFYRQARKDGGIRMGVEVDGETVLGVFESAPGNRDDDPILVWYVDILCAGPKLPREPDAVRAWLLRRSGPIRNALRKLAADLDGGIDPSLLPVRRSLRAATPGVRGEIRAWARGRDAGRALGHHLSDIEGNWEHWIGTLSVAGEVAR